MFQVEVFDARPPVPGWRGVCISDEDEAGLMFAFSDRSPARPDELDDAIDLVHALHGELGVRAGVRDLHSGHLIYDCVMRPAIDTLAANVNGRIETWTT
ncbi:hypothetical protein AACH06_19525 [Ideonella sp. DXS29W]|uniref:Uncharacterized protein n=1 Tax=Ideonella lacteola TaxID=2984193 RepID=A0ABU9BTF5_9BURK